MKRLILLVLILPLAMAAFAVSTGAASRCTLRGTPEGDFLSGTNRHDFICARNGNDYAAGQDGRDIVRGGRGNDTVIGGRGRDSLRGRGGNDKLFAIDGQGNDVLKGGPGSDQCFGEKHDRFRGCERKVTNHSPNYPLSAVMSLSKAYERLLKQATHRLCILDPLVCVK